jgi:hypothetical protein
VGAARLTIREGSRVRRERHDSLDAALAALRANAERIRAEGDLPTVQGFRAHGPEERVKARLEVSIGGWLRGRDAGVDVMGNGALVPYTGGVFKRRLEAEDAETAYDALEAALRG